MKESLKVGGGFIVIVALLMVGAFFLATSQATPVKPGTVTTTNVPTGKGAEDDPAIVRQLATCRAQLGAANCWIERDDDGYLSVYGKRP